MMPDFLGRGFRLHYEERGRGEPIVLLAGYLMDHHLFDAQVARLSTHYRCIALDRRGHGESDCPLGHWSMADLVEDVVSLIEALGTHPCHLVGMSIGGAEATRIALEYPALVRSLIYIDAPADPQLPAGASFDIEGIAAKGLDDHVLELAALMLYGKTFRSTQPEVVTAHINQIKRLPHRTIAEGLRINLNTEPVGNRLEEIAVPALVIHGSEDVALPLDKSEAVANGIADSRFVLLEGAGHSSPVEQPHAVSDAMEQFLAPLA